MNNTQDLPAAANSLAGIRRVAGRGMRLLQSVIRMIRMPRSPIYRPHHYLHYELVPNYRSPDGMISHNAYGFRGREIALEKATGCTRIVCVGESTTYCAGIRNDETWPAHLERKLSHSFPVEVINAGVPAYTSGEVLLNFVFKIEELRPDWLIYYFTINDVAPRQIGRVSRDYREFCKLWTDRTLFRSWRDVENYLAHRDAINYRVRRLLHVAHSEANIFDTTAEVFAANIRDMVALAVSRDVRVLLVCPRYRNLNGNGDDEKTKDPMSFAVAQHRAAVKAIGRTFDQPVLDMVPLMPPPPRSKAEKSDYYFDSVHLNAAGAELFAGHVADAILAQNDIRKDQHKVDVMPNNPVPSLS